MAKAKTKAELTEELLSLSEEYNSLKASLSGPQVGGVIGQIRDAWKASFIATGTGVSLGSFVPLAVWWLAHYELFDKDQNVIWYVLLLILGGLLFSAKTVYYWSKEAFQCSWKAFGFVVLVEGILTLSQSMWLSLAALMYLVGINAVATGATLATTDRR